MNFPYFDKSILICIQASLKKCTENDEIYFILIVGVEIVFSCWVCDNVFLIGIIIN